MIGGAILLLGCGRTFGQDPDNIAKPLMGSTRTNRWNYGQYLLYVDAPARRVQTTTDENDGPTAKYPMGPVDLVAGAGFEPATFGL